MNTPTQLQPAVRKHSDGSVCREGTRQLPTVFSPCCETFKQHTSACVNDVRYEWLQDHGDWVIAISDEAGGGGIAINFCPHCGADLKSPQA